MLERSRVAHVCRRSWKRVLEGRRVRRILAVENYEQNALRAATVQQPE